MDEPPADETVAGARELASSLAERAANMTGEGAALAEACVQALEAAADRRVLFVQAVPLVVAAVELLEREVTGDPSWNRALAGARYDIETILPGPIKPDVRLDSLRRGPTSGRRG